MYRKLELVFEPSSKVFEFEKMCQNWIARLENLKNRVQTCIQRNYKNIFYVKFRCQGSLPKELMNIATIALGQCENGCKNQTRVLCFIVKWDNVSEDASELGIVEMAKEH